MKKDDLHRILSMIFNQSPRQVAIKPGVDMLKSEILVRSIRYMLSLFQIRILDISLIPGSEPGQRRPQIALVYEHKLCSVVKEIGFAGIRPGCKLPPSLKF